MAEPAQLGPAIVVHNLDHAVAALRAATRIGRPITLLSAKEAGIFAGARWFVCMVKQARAGNPYAEATEILDCGADAGALQTAISAAVPGIVFTGRADVASRSAEIAGPRGILILPRRPPALLDLGADFFANPERLTKRCADALAAFC